MASSSSFKANRLLIGLLLISGSYTTSGSHRKNPPANWFQEKTIANDYDDHDGDDVVVAGQTVYDGRGVGWTPLGIGAREPVEVEDEDFRYVYQEPEVDVKMSNSGRMTKRKSPGFMGLDNVDYVASTLDLHRTLVGGRNNNNNANRYNGPSSGTLDDPRTPLATPSRHRTNHRLSVTSRFPLSANVSPSDMRRMMKTLLDAGKRRR